MTTLTRLTTPTRAGLGAVLWVVFIAVRRPAPFSTAWVHALLLLAVLVLLPFALALLAGRGDHWRADRALRLATDLQLPAALLLTAAFGLAPGPVAAALALPWLGVTALVSLAGLLRLADRRPTLSTLCVDAGALFLVVGGAWTFADRLGFQPLGFAVVIVALTAVHFHYAGLLLPMVTGLALERLQARRGFAGVLGTAAGLLVVVGVPAVAVGITATQLGLGPWTEAGAAWLMAAGGTLAGVLHLRLAVTGTGTTPTIRGLRAVCGLSLLAGMVLAALYGGRFLLPVEWLRWLDVGWMQVTHGVINGVGFGVAGTLGWWLDDRRSTRPGTSVGARRQPRT